MHVGLDRKVITAKCLVSFVNVTQIHQVCTTIFEITTSERMSENAEVCLLGRQKTISTGGHTRP